MSDRDAQPGTHPAGQSPACLPAAPALGARRIAAAAAAAVLAVLALVGWATERPGLARLGTDLPAMPPLEAIAVLALASAVLPGRLGRARPVCVVLAAGAAALAGVALVEWIGALDLQLDDRLATAALAADGSSGRPSPHAATALFLLALAGILPARHRLAAEVCAVVAALVCLATLAGMITGEHQLAEIGPRTGMSLPAVLAGLLLAATLADPWHGELRRTPAAFTWLAGAAGVSLSIIATMAAAHEANDMADRTQREDLRLAVSATRTATAPVIAALEGVATLYVPTGATSRRQFRLAARKLMRRPVLMGVATLAHVRGSGREAFEREIGPIVDVDRHRRLAPAPPRALYTVIRESVSRMSRSDGHIDLNADPVRGPAIRNAMRTGRPAATPPMASVRTGRSVIGVFLPVAGVSGSRSDVLVAGFFDARALTRQIAAALPAGLGVQISDDGVALTGSMVRPRPGSIATEIPLAGRRWQVRLDPLAPGRDRVLAAAGLGLGLTLVLVLAVGGLVRRERGAHALAARGARERDAAAEAALRAKRRSRFLEENATDVLFLMDQSSALTYVSPAAHTLLGLAPEQVLGQTITQIAHDDDLQLMHDAFLSLHGTAGTVEVAHRVQHRDGHWLWVETLVRAVRDPHTGMFLEAQGSVRDITHRREVEGRLREAENRFRSAFTEAPLGMAVVALDGTLLQINRALEELAGQEGRALRGTVFDALLHQADADTHRQAREALLAGELHTHGAELRVVRPSGQVVWTGISTALVLDADDRPQHFLTQVQNVSGRRRAEAQLQYLGDHDPLTGLLNRRAFERSLQEHLTRVRRYGPNGAVLVVDVDAFSAVNDRLGHSGGDAVIVDVALALRSRLRDSDLLARFGGDEFVILLPRANLEEALVVGGALVDVVRGMRTSATDDGPAVTVSVGVALVDRPEQRGAELLIDADLAMYDAKATGRDRVHSAWTAPADAPRMRAAGNDAQLVRDAIRQDRLVLFAEPVVDLRTGSVVQLELLLRIRGADGDLQVPASFMAVAERHDLVQALDLWVIGRAIALLSANPDGPAMSVNVSMRSVQGDVLVDFLGEEFTAQRVDPRRLTVEISEHEAVAHLPRLQELSRELRHLGCPLAIDDFGAGFGGFYSLKHLPFDVLKIDGEFVRHCASEHADQVIIAAVVEAARALGARTIAEFVEDDVAVTCLRNLGVDAAQGHHFALPMPVQEALADARVRRTGDEG
jgi:diguanylate cyclase (GGDEF)-like protein/PAS domain S-box-containing protein